MNVPVSIENTSILSPNFNANNVLFLFITILYNILSDLQSSSPPTPVYSSLKLLRCASHSEPQENRSSDLTMAGVTDHVWTVRELLVSRVHLVFISLACPLLQKRIDGILGNNPSTKWRLLYEERTC